MMVSVDRYEGLDGDELDRVSDLPSLPGSRKTSEQMRKLSGKSFLYTQSPLLSLTLAPWMSIHLVSSIDDSPLILFIV